MPVMKGGGAERVAAQLMNEFHRKGHDVRFLLTSCRRTEVIRTDLHDEIPLVLLQEEIDQAKSCVGNVLSRKMASSFCRSYEAMGKAVPAKLAYWSFMAQYGRETQYLRKLMEDEPDLIVIAFLQPSIPMVVLAGRSLPNRVFFSERGNPIRLMKHRYGRNFIETYYDRIFGAVFQTDDARKAYPKVVANKGELIENPLKKDLPESYFGKRKHTITTFCRISEQKNLPMLIEAFRLLHRDYPNYKLRIIGDASNVEGKRVAEEVNSLITKYRLEDVVEQLPFSANVHEEVLKDAMYVNTSDYEGISNAMLEAMAIGLPVVCTDCPIGGAKATIEDGVNGLLVPVGDAHATYLAMKRIIEDQDLSKTLSINASKLRDKLSLEHIAQKWMELL